MQKRNIRFRGKATGKGNIPTNWVYGGGCFAVNGNTFIIPDVAPKFTGNGEYETKAIEVRFICQSTGLHDIFKSEVFEGDVVRLDGNKKYTYVVEWNDAHTSFLARCVQTKTGLANLSPYVSIEILGNIHDNPNLLNVGSEAIIYCNKHIYATGKGYK
jgi:hypothetical protein